VAFGSGEAKVVAKVAQRYVKKMATRDMSYQMVNEGGRIIAIEGFANDQKELCGCILY
jgi:hypothetical protein